MATWKTAPELSRRYLVGAERLLDYSRRGNLPMRREADGTPLFDEDIVARLFRLRHALGVPLTSGANLGVLGETRLGTFALPTTESSREARRRALRFAEAPRAAPVPTRRAAG